MTRPRTLPEMLADRVAHDPQAVAFVFSGRSTTFGELWTSIGRCAGGLTESGLAAAEPIVVALPNGPAFFAAFYGAQLAGGVPVPTFPGSGPPRLRALARRCGARRILVAGSDPRAGDKGSARGREEQFLSVDRLLADGDVAEDYEVAPDDLAYIQYTSGSTGEPKGVRLTHRNVLTNIGQLIAGFEITPEDVFVSWLPAYHDMGLVLMTMVPFTLGARLVLLPASLRSLRPWLAAIDEHGGTFTAAPDFGYRMALRASRGREKPNLSSLRVALNAAEPVRASTIAAFEDAFGLESVMIAGYGLAEATVGVAAWAPGTPRLVDAAGAVSVGRPFPDVEVEIQANERLLGPGERGEILVRSPANTCGYVDEPEEHGDLFWKDRFLRTGDLGYIDASGFLFVVGRSKQMIIQAGRTIAPREVEEIVDARPFVRHSAAVGIDRGDAAGEQLYVFAEMRDGTRPEDPECRARVVAIVGALHRDLGLRPGRVYLTAARAIPFTPNGKVRYGDLRKSFRSGRLRREGRLWYPEW